MTSTSQRVGMERWLRIEEIFQMSEGFEAVFSGGKREREEEEERPDPIIAGRKPWVYGGLSGQGRGGG
jgi:hypothetical protein